MNNGWTQNPPAELIKGTPEWFAERDRILAAWEASKLTLEKAKEDEMNLRKEFVKFAFDNEKLSGTERVELNNGYQAKAVKKLNFKFVSRDENVKVVDAVDKSLTEIEALGGEAPFIADRLVKWSADLSVGEYNKLTESETGRKIKAIIDNVIETTEGAPTLEIVPPKGSK
ncbi:hypothetical protein Pfeifenkraut_BL30069 [Xanthomonas phage Pfeifenkraut]|uniref:Uncharacterized protein n=1 Tax=Xanthomonas phage Pfeifenkraut TaxID=2939132 RepID=A0A9E7E152_9CAUD|nr:hypothetical protein QAY91_gp69 [Xanthomonas phage Pfeifenkraut]URA06966.1 hypothetical protein Pfeifenkraut_BL30069 [Xanthomonas phage Pfeifenkraut]